MHFSYRKIKKSISFFLAVTAAFSVVFSGTGFHAAAAEDADQDQDQETSYLMLPSAGVDYILSGDRVSLRDIEIAEETRHRQMAGAILASDGSAGAATVMDTPVPLSALPETAAADAAQPEASTAVEAIPDEELSAYKAETGVEEAAETAADTVADIVESQAEVTALAAAEPQGTAQAVEKIIIEPVMTQTQKDAVLASIPVIEEEEEEPADASGTVTGTDIAVAMVSDFVYMRAEPSTDAEVVGKLYANGVGHIVGEEKDGWVPVRSGDVTGYVKAEFLFVGEGAKELADIVSVTKATVTTETLRVRVAPDIESDVITLIPGGQSFDVLSQEGDWIKVDTPDGMGYISADYADIEQVYPEAESRAQEEARLAAEAAAAEAKRKAAEAERRAEQARQAARAAQQAQAANAAALQQAADQATAAAAQAQAAVTASTNGTAQGQAVASFALQFVGNPYVWGGSSLTNGTDCSGFTMAVYAHFGISLPHYDASQRNYGTPVGSLAEAAPGDLVCYYGHVGIYIGGGQIVHASNPREGIKVSNAAYRSIVAIRRIFN